MTVIKHFITGEKLNGNYVKWQKKNQNGKIENIFYEKNKHTKNNRARNKRFMTEDERDKFNEFNLSICIINTNLDFKNVCTIFNRLQNGERTTGVDRLKNQDHPLTNLLRKANIGRLEPFKKTKIGKYLWKIFMKNKKGKTSTSVKKFFASILMRYALIYVKGIDNITSYLDLNMTRDIETKSERADISSKTSEEIIENMENFLKSISTTIKNKNITIHMFYILADIYNHTLNENMSKGTIKDIVNSDIFSEFNNDLKFCKKGGVPSPAKYKEVRNMLIDICKENESDTQESSEASDESEYETFDLNVSKKSAKKVRVVKKRDSSDSDDDSDDECVSINTKN